MKTLTYGRDDTSAVIKRLSIDYSDAVDSARQIISSVRKRGDEALKECSLKYDRQDIGQFRLTEAEIEEAYGRTDKKTLAALRRAYSNITKTHKKQYENTVRDWEIKVEKGVFVGERFSPLPSVGCYVPGGRASYPSTVLMTVTPAKIAGVERVVVVSPPPVADAVVAAAKIAGADEIYRVGGAQAIAALAYGTESIKPVSKIVGPGNKYVTAAKMLVYGAVDVDMPAGPSEVLIVADGKADAEYIASDILAQLEHDPNAQAVLVSNDSKLIGRVSSVAYVKARTSERRSVLEESLANVAFVKTKTLTESIRFANEYAPEHLEIHTESPERVAEKISNAGAIFVGAYSPVAAGDYASGGNHVLPTGGAAKYSSQLSVRDFVKSTSTQKITRQGLRSLAPTIKALAEKEGLIEHKNSVDERLS